MKTIFRNITAALMVCAAIFMFTSCNDDSGSESFKSDLIGSYTPYYSVQSSPLAALSISATWSDPNNVPTVDLSALGMGEVSMNELIPLVNQILGSLYGGGLVQFDFKNDGTFAFQYRELLDFATMQFSPTVTSFPGADAQGAAMASALGYYSKSGKVYFSIERSLVAQLGSETGQDVCALIDGMLVAYPNLGVDATDKSYAIPLKYGFDEQGRLTIYVDKAMMMPYLPLLQTVVLPLLPESIEIAEGVALPTAQLVPAILDGLFNKTEALVISLTMVKI